MKIKTYSLLFLSFFAFLLVSQNGFAYPKFAAYTGEKCVSCHVNPTGAGIRNPYGLKYSKDNLYLKPFEKANKTTDINPQITKGIQIGSDFRLAYFDDQTGEGNPNFNTFFMMEGDLYVNAQVNKYINLVVAPSLSYPSTYVSTPGQTPAPIPYKSEYYGMVSHLPAGLYMKIGRFIPNFGTKIAEHRAYQRQFNDFYTPYAADAGMEIGIAPGMFTLTAGLSNGSSYNVKGELNNSFDFDNQKQFTASGDFRWASKNSKYTFGIGGSFLTNPFKYDPDNNVNAVRQVAAGFMSIGLMERIAILGEITYNRLKIQDANDTKSDFRIFFGELDARITKGLEVKFQYENYDPALGVKDATSERQRYSFGATVFPLTGLEIESVFRLVKEGKGDGPVPFDIKNDEFQTIFKFYF